MKRAIVLLSLVVTMVSCTNTETYEKIIGEWECISWSNESRGIDKCNDNVYFKFQPDKYYYSVLASAKDSGDYKISGEKLHVTPEGKMEFAVKIAKLNEDTLVFRMNQAGEEEILTLVRKKE